MTKYLWVLALSGVFPFILSFWPGLQFYRNARSLACTLACVLVLFGAWDVWATFRGHWDFDPCAVLPVRIINLPVEEVLFFLVIPFCCIFTWEVMGYLARKRR